MDKLQRTLERALKKAFSVDKIIASIINKKLKERGIVLNDKQLFQLQKKIKNSKNLGTLHFRIDEEEALQCPSDVKGKPNASISLAIDAEKDLSNVDNKISNIVENLIPQIVCETSEGILETLRKNFHEHQKYPNDQIKCFNEDLKQVWRKPLDLLEMFYYLAVEAGDTFNYHLRPASVKQNNFVFDVVTRLHARSCQITAEIILLLKNGFADGAHARWRTLHEIAVIAYFVAKHGNDLAERYLCHTAVESYKASLKYQVHCEALGYQQLTEKEMTEIREKYQYYVNKYGASYKQSYGWASKILTKDNPTIADIEADVGLNYMRPYYKMASHNVHANPQGILFKLGLIPESGDILLTGPSNLGLADPGYCAAISLLQITTNLLTTIEPNLDRLVILNILSTLKNEIGEQFYRVDEKLKENTVT